MGGNTCKANESEDRKQGDAKAEHNTVPPRPTQQALDLVMKVALQTIGDAGAAGKEPIVDLLSHIAQLADGARSISVHGALLQSIIDLEGTFDDDDGYIALPLRNDGEDVTQVCEPSKETPDRLLASLQALQFEATRVVWRNDPTYRLAWLLASPAHGACWLTQRVAAGSLPRTRHSLRRRSHLK